MDQLTDRLRFCPLCAGRLEPRPLGDYAAERHPVCATCGFTLWQNPKPCVDAVILSEVQGRPSVLLGRQRGGPGAGLWDAPGGYLNLGDGIEAAVRRECRREVGVEVDVEALLGAFDGVHLGGQIVTLVYRCRLVSGEPQPGGPVDRAGWFPLSQLPPIASSAISEVMQSLTMHRP
jgi:ADP-ribose pyrophosphatase YjhB (NUDIX family)